MFGALKFVPRDEVDLHADKKETTRGRSSKRKHNNGKDYRKGASKEKEKRKEKRARSSDSDGTGESGGRSQDSDREAEASTLDPKEDAKTRRAEAGLGWMLNAPDRPFGGRGQPIEEAASTEFEEENHEQKPELNSKELNPSLTNAETGQHKVQKSTVPAGVGDRGASWRLKALKRAQELAAREGRKLDEVVEERWGSLGTLTGSVATARSAHANAHLHSIRDRKSRTDADGAGRSAADSGKESERGSSRGPGGEVRDRGSHREHGSKMRVPQTDSNLSWKSRRKFGNLREADAAILRSAATTFNKYASDGSFLRTFEDAAQSDSAKAAAEVVPEKGPEGPNSPSDTLDIVYEPKKLFPTVSSGPESSSGDEAEPPKHGPAKTPETSAGEDHKSMGLSANQVAAKAMRLRLSGKTKEADELLKDFEAGLGGTSSTKGPSTTQRFSPTRASGQQSRQQRMDQGLGASSLRAQDSLRARNQSHDAEMAQIIARNKSYRGDETDEYDDYGNGLETQKIHERPGKMKKPSDKGAKPFKSFTTRQENCQFCFENPRRPKHLVIAIANFTYLMLPPGSWLVPDHCYIVPMQHDGASRNVDENVWQELRNFKKCLVQMFAKCHKKALFLETVMGLSRQRRHFYIECIPIPNDTRAADAPLYFKKAIDEVEDEWSQHNAKKLIDTKERGLRNSIPKNFPYFHVEFGLEGGYCHVIDDESKFDPHFGRDVVAGIIEQEEKMARAGPGSLEQQRARVDQFLQNWKEFDWTKMLD